jgi:hypothetical protein
MKITKHTGHHKFVDGSTSINFNSVEFDTDITRVSFVMNDRVSASITKDDVYEFMSMNWNGLKDVYENEGKLDYIYLGGL